MSEVPSGVLYEQASASDPKTYLGRMFPASADGRSIVFATSTTDDNGRSPWMWIQLANGDLILGTFPQGDTYMELEGCVEADYLATQNQQKII